MHTRAVRDYIAVAEAEGAALVHAEQTRRHYRLTFAGPAGAFTVVTPGTPSDRRGILNFRADIRRRLRAPCIPTPLRSP